MGWGEGSVRLLEQRLAQRVLAAKEKPPSWRCHWETGRVSKKAPLMPPPLRPPCLGGRGLLLSREEQKGEGKDEGGTPGVKLQKG